MLDGLANPEASFTLLILGFMLFGGLYWSCILVAAWIRRAFIAAGNRSGLKQQRQQGLLDQANSLPYVGRDGGRGPGGGRYLLGQRPEASAYFSLAVVWLPAAISLMCTLWLLRTASLDFLFAAIASVTFTLLAAGVSPYVFPLEPYRVEVDPCPAAVGDRIKIRLGKREPQLRHRVTIRLLLIERIQSQVAGVSGWTQEILWDEPFFQSERTSDGRYQVTVRIPENQPGTYLAPDYRLEWLIEVSEHGYSEMFPLPVVK